jgi:polyhydroxybutyrate depolymerase
MTSKIRWCGMLGTLAILAVLSACKSEFTYEVTRSQFDRLDTLQSGGVARTFEVHLPSDYETTSSPVVILFHGVGGSGMDMKLLTSFDYNADAYGFLAVYPDATSDWAYGCGCSDAEAAGVDDVQFVADLLDDLDANYGINRDSVFVVGFGDGAHMAQKVVCDATDSFAGMVTVASTMSVPLSESCAPTREIPVLMLHGTEDENFPWDGALDWGLESVLAADTTAQFWAMNNVCGERAESVFFGSDAYYNFDVYIDGFEACPANGDVVLYRMDGAQHGWPNAEFNASDEIGRFVSGGCCGTGAPAFSTHQ